MMLLSLWPKKVTKESLSEIEMPAMAPIPHAYDFSTMGKSLWLKSKRTPSPPTHTAIDFGMR